MNVILPKVALTMTQATIVEWFKEQGDSITKGEILFSMETDKSELEVESPGDGTLREILYSAGDTVQAGAVVAVLENGDEDSSDDDKPSATADVAPAAASLAAEIGVDINSVVGTGTGGRVLESDVMKVAADPSSASVQSPRAATNGSEPEVEVVEFSRARGAGMRLTEHTTNIPTFILSGLIDFEERQADMESAGVSVTDVLAIAIAVALREVPLANARIRGGRVERYLHPRVGILVRQEDALIPLVFDDPAEHDAATFRTQRTEAASALRRGRLPVEQTSGPTFVISNLGRFNVEFFSAILFPETAITMATGSIGANTTHPGALRAVLTCDHRIIDGMDAAEFLASVREAVADVRL